MKRYQLASQVAAPGAQTAVYTATTDNKVEGEGYLRSFQASIVGGGAATVVVQGSNDNKSWLTLATISLDATTTSDGFSSEVPWVWVRANITAVATGKVDVVMAT